MKKYLFVLPVLLMILNGCEYDRTEAPGRERAAGTAGQAAGQAGQAAGQAESAVDQSITQSIRQALMDNDTLSTLAKNIRINTSNGVVTLRGMVSSDREKNAIGAVVKALSGVRSVDNQLEVSGAAPTGPEARTPQT